MITFHNATKIFLDGTVAVRNLSFTVKKGSLVALVGPSGCGKTTTLKMINKLIPLSSGTITIHDKDIEQEHAVELRRNIGYVIQRIGLLPHMTIAENVSLVPKLKGWKKEKYERRVEELLAVVGLDPAVYKNRYPLELSGGQQQRVGVIRALAGDPSIILMDEPFSALDPISREQLQNELKLLQLNLQKTIVFVTHDMDEACKLADEIVLMKAGAIEQIASPKQLLQAPANDFVRSFIGEHRLAARKEQASAAAIMRLIVCEPDWTAPAIPSHISLREAAQVMLQYNSDSLTLVDENRKPLGIITKNDLLQELAGIGGVAHDTGIS